VLSGRGLCDELITRPEEYYRLCCVVVCDLETSKMGAPYIYDISRLRVKDSITKLTVWLLEQSDEVTISVCSLRNTELTATNAGYIQNSTGNARYRNIEAHSPNSIAYSECVSVFLP